MIIDSFYEGIEGAVDLCEHFITTLLKLTYLLCQYNPILELEITEDF